VASSPEASARASPFSVDDSSSLDSPSSPKKKGPGLKQRPDRKKKSPGPKKSPKPSGASGGGGGGGSGGDGGVSFGADTKAWDDSSGKGRTSTDGGKPGGRPGVIKKGFR